MDNFFISGFGAIKGFIFRGLVVLVGESGRAAKQMNVWVDSSPETLEAVKNQEVWHLVHWLGMLLDPIG
jgi:uncharacterized membrane protein required for colicin V production